MRGRIVEIAILIGLITAIVGGAILFAKVYDLSQSIQENRVEFIRDECEDVNQRLDNAIVKLRAEADAVIARVPEKEDIVRERQHSSARLIRQIVPRRNCDQIVRLAEIDS